MAGVEPFKSYKLLEQRAQNTSSNVPLLLAYVMAEELTTMYEISWAMEF